MRTIAPLLFILLMLPNGRVLSGEHLRVLSYNIHHAEGVDGKLDLERIARVIRSVEPDLVALQEVDRRVERTRKVDQPAELARLTGMHVAFGPNIPLQGGEYGNAVLSRWAIRKSQNHLLPCLKGGEQRGVLEATIAWPDNDNELVLLATHFDHRSDGAERLESARMILRQWNSEAEPEVTNKSPRRMILAGDLNAGRESDSVRLLSSIWRITNDERLPTVPVGLPREQIDFVLVRPMSRWKVVETRVLDEAIASDHRAILAVLEPQ